MDSTWTPLVTGEMAARSLAAAKAIARDLASQSIREALGPDLRRGRTGVALFFAYGERSLGDAAAGELAQDLIEESIAELAVETAPAAALYGGFTGVAWVVEHLEGGETTAEDEDPNAVIDAALLSILRRGPWRGAFGLVSGLVGLGVYALERWPRPSAAALFPFLVARLADCAEPELRGAVWRNPQTPRGEPDLGMAHGAAGVIALLSRMVQEGAGGPEAEALLASAVEGALAHLPEGEGDLAWCAGEAGLSAALLAAGRACGRDDWERTACRLAATAAGRDSGDAEGLDPAFCHGTAGLSHLLHRLYQATGDPALLAAARRWLERTLERHRPGEGIGGYLCRGRQADGGVGWLADPSFLTGAAGIGLVLLAAATPVEPAWDRLLLLSGRE